MTPHSTRRQFLAKSATVAAAPLALAATTVVAKPVDEPKPPVAWGSEPAKPVPFRAADFIDMSLPGSDVLALFCDEQGVDPRAINLAWLTQHCHYDRKSKHLSPNGDWSLVCRDASGATMIWVRRGSPTWKRIDQGLPWFCDSGKAYVWDNVGGRLVARPMWTAEANTIRY